MMFNSIVNTFVLIAIVWFIRNVLESSISHTEDEQCVSGEVECVEKTLLKRRAELREADRLLLEAQTELKDTRDKVRPHYKHVYFKRPVRRTLMISCLCVFVD